jgi:hypothetical protein
MELCAKLPKAQRLHRDLEDIQSRMGGPHEQPHDQSQAASIAHTLNNMLCAISCTESPAVDQVNPPKICPTAREPKNRALHEQPEENRGNATAV